MEGEREGGRRHVFGFPSYRPRRTTSNPPQRFPVDTVRAAANAGFAAMTLPATDGGAGLSRVAAAAAFEALAGGDVSVAAYLSIHNMVTSAVATHGSVDQKAKWLPGLTSGQVLGAYCLTEPGAGSDAASLRTRAEVAPDGSWRLTGDKAFISGASVAGVFLVMARTGAQPVAGAQASSGISAFLVDANAPCVSIGPPETKMGWRCQPTCSVAFNSVAVAPDALLGEPGRAFGRVALAALDGGRVNIAALSVGGAASALTKARAYAASRRQFGQAVLDFQGTAFALADAATAVHASRLAVRSAAAALDARDPAATLQAALAKRFATDACFDAANACLQAFGGYGYLAEYDVERIVRDLRVHSILEGTNQVMRVIISRELDKMDGREP